LKIVHSFWLFFEGCAAGTLLMPRGSAVRLPRIRLRTVLLSVAIFACLLWYGAVRRIECPNCRERASLARSFRDGACPQCGLSY
jgi:hypothetical protein